MDVVIIVENWFIIRNVNVIRSFIVNKSLKFFILMLKIFEEEFEVMFVFDVGFIVFDEDILFNGDFWIMFDLFILGLGVLFF